MISIKQSSSDKTPESVSADIHDCWRITLLKYFVSSVLEIHSYQEKMNIQIKFYVFAWNFFL